MTNEPSGHRMEWTSVAAIVPPPAHAAVEHLAPRMDAVTDVHIPATAHPDGEAATPATAVQALLRDFVRLVAPLAQVQQVFSDLTDGEPAIWTVTDVDRDHWDQYVAVYDAELAAGQAHPEIPVDFRLINLGDYGPEQRATLIPCDMTVNFKR